MNSTTEYKTSKMELHAYVAKAFPQLKQLKKKDDRAAFNELMGKILPSVRQYIRRQVPAAVKNGSIPSGKYKVADFVDELYIMAYDHIQDVKEDKHLLSWLFEKADGLLEDTLVEEDFDHTFYENIDDYSKLEWDEMEEKFSTDGDGDLVMEEELDDLSYPKNDYILKDVFVEDKEADLIGKLDKELAEEEIQRHIELVLYRLPLLMRTIFDLAVCQHFSPDEIAGIKKMDVQKVNQYLSDTKRYIRISFKNRYMLE